MAILKSNRCERDHTVVCQSGDSRHNVPMIPGALTVSDAIYVENDIVFNCLVDQTRMDSTILVTDEQDCKRYFERTNGLDGFNDRRIKSALTLRGTKIEFRGGNMVRWTPTSIDLFIILADHRLLSISIYSSTSLPILSLSLYITPYPIFITLHHSLSYLYHSTLLLNCNSPHTLMIISQSFPKLE